MDWHKSVARCGFDQALVDKFASMKQQRKITQQTTNNNNNAFKIKYKPFLFATHCVDRASEPASQRFGVVDACARE
jgi:hypothetical protein